MIHYGIEDIEKVLAFFREHEKEDVGVYKSDSKSHVITNGDGQNPHFTICPELFKFLNRKHYLKGSWCTNLNHNRFFYPVNLNPPKLQDILDISTSTKCLDGKEFYIVPKGKKRVFINFDDSIATSKFTKKIEEAFVYNKEKLWDIYLNFAMLWNSPYYYVSHRRYSKKGTYTIFNNNEDSIDVKEFEILTLDKKRFSFNKIVRDFSFALSTDLIYDKKDIDKKIEQYHKENRVLYYSTGIKYLGSYFTLKPIFSMKGLEVIENLAANFDLVDEIKK